MNKQEVIEEIEKIRNNIEWIEPREAIAFRRCLNIIEQLDEPSREECEIIETERNDYVSDFQCSKCKVCFDLFRWVYAPNTRVNYCPNCGRKIKREKRDE